MKKEDAIEHLRVMQHAIQKMRSISNEEIGVEATKFLKNVIMPFILGDKCILSTVVKVIENYENTGELEPLTFYNLIVVATRLEPSIGMACQIYGKGNFPESADMYWLQGFENKENN